MVWRSECAGVLDSVGLHPVAFLANVLPPAKNNRKLNMLLLDAVKEDIV